MKICLHVPETSSSVGGEKISTLDLSETRLKKSIGKKEKTLRSRWETIRGSQVSLRCELQRLGIRELDRSWAMTDRSAVLT